MAKGTLTFNLEDSEDLVNFKRAVHASDAYRALWDIAQEVFRPARKHGYSDMELGTLAENENVVEAISLLEKKFYEILEEYNVDIND